MSTVVIEGLRKKFGENLILPSFDLSMEDGEFVVLLGPSGCGKTTVLRCLAGLEQPTAGRIQIGDKLVEDTAARVSVPTQKRELGLVFQNYALWPHMNVWDNIAYPLRVRRVGRDETARKVADVLALVGLEQYGSRSPAELSGGQQQRVALARALVASPRLLLLDEPLSNLDAQRRVRLRKRLRDIHREVRTSTVYVTHDQLEALTMADRVLIMRAGRIEQSGPPRQVFEHPVNRFVADFLGYENILSATVLSADGRIVTARSDSWEGDLSVESSAYLPAGMEIELAFRANNVSLHPVLREAGILSNTRPMQIGDITFLGDSVEYVMRGGSGQIVARVAAKHAGGLNAIGAPRLASIAPQDIALLTAERAPIAEAVAGPRRRKVWGAA